MALVLLIVIGSTLGWVASIVTRSEASGTILRYIGIGVLGSLIAGIIANNGAFLGGLNLVALAASVGGAVIAVAIYYAARRQVANG